MKERTKCKIVIFSDLHYAPEKPINNGSRIEKKLMEYSIPLLNQIIYKINDEIKPDITINLGDLVEDFNDHDKDIENLSFIWNMFKSIKVPFYSLAGNHDLRAMESREEVEKIMGYKHSTYSVDINGYHFVFLGLNVNTNIGHAEGGIFKTQFISDEDMKWLRIDLEQNALPCIVLNHFGIAEDDMKGNWWFEECPECALLGNRKELKEILKNDKNLLAVFSGHQHWTKKVIEDGITYYILGSMTENMNNDGIPDGVYFEVDLEDRKIDVKEKHLRI
jgi:predicted phosphodiesterase